MHMRSFLVIFIVVTFLTACDQMGSSSDSSKNTGVNFSDQNSAVVQLPIFEAREDAIKVTWHRVPEASSYEVFWEDDSGVQSNVVDTVTYTIVVSGYQTFLVWVSAFDDNGDVIATSRKVSMNSLDTTEKPAVFSDAAPE